MRQEQADKIKAGDKLLCLDDTASFGRLRAGQVYTASGPYDYGVRLQGLDDRGYMAERFELAREAGDNLSAQGIAGDQDKQGEEAPDYGKMKYSGVKLEGGEIAYYLDLQGRDMSFNRWRIYAYYACGYAATVLFSSEAEYLAYIAAASGKVYTNFREFEADMYQAEGNFTMAKWCREAREAARV